MPTDFIGVTKKIPSEGAGSTIEPARVQIAKKEKKKKTQQTQYYRKNRTLKSIYTHLWSFVNTVSRDSCLTLPTVTTAVHPALASLCAAPLLPSQCPPAAESTLASRSRTPKQGMNFQVGFREKCCLRKDKIKADAGVHAE